MISEKTIAKIETLLKNFEEDKKNALIPVLYAVQEETNHFSAEDLTKVAEILDIPKAKVFEVASFYARYSTESLGKNIIRICNSICCYLRDSENIIEILEKELGIKIGETTKDGKFSLLEVECLGACGIAPAMMINDETYGNLTEAEIKKILNKLK